ncbi:hypothetical protein [Mycolicibacterium sphagni]|uniref:Uncharacterized protein n=1 Tax=Mycolicibacterium sphagni TaxID=1786 RepID=A0A255DMG3_9MYCO|nr:hypothetical protein [Mycolicibacterium sphagni]OYN76843.1 hypothetical protein CG716_20225 [Mycolicibacterium sphagni]
MTAALADADVVAALTKSVHSTEASRRVGWARMYAALAAGEKAERELGIAREDIALLSKFAGFTYGALQALGLRDIYHAYLRGDLDQLQSYFPNGAMQHGREVGSTWGKDWINRLADKTEYYKARAAAHEVNEKQWAAAKVAAANELATEYGFASADEMREYLAQHKPESTR